MNHTTQPQDAVSPSVAVSADRATLLREAATRLWHQTNGLTEYGRGARWAVAELRAMADCPACEVGVEHDVHGVAAEEQPAVAEQPDTQAREAFVPPDPYRVLVTGSRDWEKEDVIRFALDYAFCEAARSGRALTLVHGACPRGADAQAADYANYLISRDLPVKIEPHPANWQINGKQAGFIRNSLMVNLGADLCLAFIRNGSRGASHTARLAEAAGIPVRRFTA